MKTINRLIGAYSSLIQDVGAAAEQRRELSRSLRTMAAQKARLEQVQSLLEPRALRIAQRRNLEIGIKRCIVRIEKMTAPTVSITPEKTRGITSHVEALLQVLPGDPDLPPPRRKKKKRAGTAR